MAQHKIALALVFSVVTLAFAGCGQNPHVTAQPEGAGPNAVTVGTSSQPPEAPPAQPDGWQKGWQKKGWQTGPADPRDEEFSAYYYDDDDEALVDCDPDFDEGCEALE